MGCDSQDVRPWSDVALCATVQEGRDARSGLVASMNLRAMGLERSRSSEPGPGAAPSPGAVVVLLDSARALPAALWGAQQCRRAGTPLHLVACESGERQRGAALASLLRRVNTIVETAVQGIPISTGLLQGDPVGALTDLSANATMIVVSAVDVAGERWSVDALALGLVSQGLCPVVIWRPTDAAGPSAPVVVGVDGSPVSARALEFALHQASSWRAPLVVVMAWSDVFFDARGPAIGVVTDWDKEAEDSRRLLAEQLAGAQERFPDVSIDRVLTHDRPVRALLKAADGAQLLVVGSHGRGGFPGMLVGSVSRALIDSSPCPLAVVRPAAADGDRHAGRVAHVR
jgi:nucleotide-binding universal stress UspA family protein